MSKNEIRNNNATNDEAVDRLAEMLIARMSATVDDSVNKAIAAPIGEIKDDQKKINKRLDKIEATTTIESREQGVLQRCVKDRVQYLLRFESPSGWKKYSRTFFARCQSNLRDRFCVPSYRDIRKVDFQLARDIVNDWEPRGGVQALKDWVDDRDDGEAVKA